MAKIPCYTSYVSWCPGGDNAVDHGLRGTVIGGTGSIFGGQGHIRGCGDRACHEASIRSGEVPIILTPIIIGGIDMQASHSLVRPPGHVFLDEVIMLVGNLA